MRNDTRHTAAALAIEGLIDEQIELQEIDDAQQQQQRIDDAADDAQHVAAGDIVFSPSHIARAEKGVHRFLADRAFDADETETDESLMESYFGSGVKDDEADYLE